MIPLPIRLTIALALAVTAAGHAQSAPPPVVLVELFTSEGCSSCPPADALLRQVNASRTASGQLIVGISEHVTYWNQLGWADPFSASDYTERQNAYGHRFHLDGVYTPQMVINGSEQIVGSDRGALLRAVRAEAEEHSPITLQIVTVQSGGTGVTVHFTLNGELPAGGMDLMAVLADDSDRSNVLRGENSGENLLHVSVARSIARVARVKAAGERTVQISLPSSFQASEKHHLILFAQTPGYGRILAADSRPL